MWSFYQFTIMFCDISSHLWDCNRHDGWHLYIPCTYWPHVHLAHLARKALSLHCFIMIKSVYMLNCTMNVKSIWSHTSCMILHVLIFCFVWSCHYIILVNLYDHMPHVCYCMYYCFVLFDHVIYYTCKTIQSCAWGILLHVCMLYCLFNCSSVNHLKPYADH